MPVQTQLQQRRGTAASWTSTNPTLAAGEIGFESDTNKFKIGTGSTAWASLSYWVQDPVTTKGDLYTFSTTDTRLPVGNNGETIVADSSTSTGLRYNANFSAGKNVIINGAFDVWQRGTSFTLTNNSDNYTTDRLIAWFNGSTNGTNTLTRQTFTAGQTDVPNNPTYFVRWTATTLGSGQTVCDFRQRVENVAQFAGQTVAFSFYLKASSAIASGNLSAYATQNFGSGGSTAVDTLMTLSSTAIGTSWTRYTATATLPSITGKTVGTSNFVQYFVRVAGISNGIVLDTSNWQVEAGSVATAFQTATGTIQGELAACQRYFYLTNSADGAYTQYGIGQAVSTSAAKVTVPFPVTMRIAPTSVVVTGNIGLLNASDTAINNGTIAVNVPSNNRASLQVTGSSGVVAGNATAVMSNNSLVTSLAFSAEL
jgi:hypothetical protein